MGAKAKAFIVLVISFLLLSGCSKPPAPEPSPAAAGEAQNPGAAFTPGTYQTKLVFIKKKPDGKWLAVDERGIVHEVDDAKNWASQGAVSKNAVISRFSSGNYQVVFDYPSSSYDVHTIYAESEEVPRKFAMSMLEDLVYTGYERIAVSEFRLKDVQVVKDYTPGRIDVSMSFDVKPIKSAYPWGLPGSDGYVKNREYQFTIYGADNTWLKLDYWPPISLDEVKQPPKTRYTPTEKQKVIFENDQWSYFSDVIMLPQSKELQETGLQEYIGTISRISCSSGKVEKLYEGGRNTDYLLFEEYKDNLYILSEAGYPGSEGWPSDFGVLDLKTNTYKRLIEGYVVRATVIKDKGYLFVNDKLIEIDLNNSSLRTICKLPAEPHYIYGANWVRRVLDGKMYFTIMNDSAGFEKSFVVDLADGKVDEIE